MLNFRRLSRALHHSLLAAGLLAACAVQAQTSRIDLPAAPLERSLNALARQTGVQVLFASEIAAGRNAPAVNGNLTPRQALDRLLAGQGLEAEERSPGVYLVRQAQAGPAAPTSPTTSSIQQRAPDDTELDAVLVVAQRANRVSKGATGLDMDIKDTPQSISIVAAGQMRDFGADNLNDALRLATGIGVEQWDTRTNYTSRGFDVLHTYIDGTGLANDGGVIAGAYDSHGYDKVEVIRGANGQLTGIGNGAGSINYVRKRPTNERQGEFGLRAGSWNQRRVEADYSTPFTGNGTWAGRFVAAWEQSDSWLDLQNDDRLFLQGVVDGQIGQNGTIAFGYSFQDSNARGSLMSQLPIAYSDGTQAEFPRSTTTAQDWGRWDTLNHNAFIEFTHQLGGSWLLKATYNYRKYEEKQKSLYAWPENGLDPQTGEGMLGIPYSTGGVAPAHQGEVSVSGRFNAFGREHEAVLGINLARSTYTWVDADADPEYWEIPVFPYPDGYSLPEPAWGPGYETYSGKTRQRRAFGASRWSLTDRLKAILGFNHTWFRNDDLSFWSGPSGKKLGEFSPYAGLTFDITDDALIYASYSDIFSPQSERDVDRNVLAPTQGVNYEVGVKAEWLERRLLTTLAWFTAEQRGLATYAGYHLPDYVYYYEGADVKSKGWEFEATGKLNDYVDLVFGYTTLELDGLEGEDSSPWVPRRTANLSLAGRIPSLPQLRLGLGGRWQSRIENSDIAQFTRLRQDAYAVLKAFADWKINDQLSLHANADNLTDEKYLSSLYAVGGYYGAPRSYSLGLNWKF